MSCYNGDRVTNACKPCKNNLDLPHTHTIATVTILTALIILTSRARVGRLRGLWSSPGGGRGWSRGLGDFLGGDLGGRDLRKRDLRGSGLDFWETGHEGGVDPGAGRGVECVSGRGVVGPQHRHGQGVARVVGQLRQDHTHLLEHGHLKYDIHVHVCL